MLQVGQKESKLPNYLQTHKFNPKSPWKILYQLQQEWFSYSLLKINLHSYNARELLKALKVLNCSKPILYETHPIPVLTLSKMFDQCTAPPPPQALTFCCDFWLVAVFSSDG